MINWIKLIFNLRNLNTGTKMTSNIPDTAKIPNTALVEWPRNKLMESFLEAGIKKEETEFFMNKFSYTGSCYILEGRTKILEDLERRSNNNYYNTSSSPIGG